jgi:hypothetical protein
MRVNCAVQMRDHARTVHGHVPDYLNKYLEPPNRRKMKNPNKELPPLEKLSEYEGHLCVFADVRPGETKSQYGMSECNCLVWVYNKSAWKALGDTPIFWQTVGRELMNEIGPESDTPTETIGAFLRKGGHPQRNGDFFWLDAAQDKPDLDLLKAWNKEYGESF